LIILQFKFYKMSLEKYVLHLADNALIYSQRLCEWCGHAPELEVDIAISNIALDHIGASRSFYQYAATLIGNGATEDSLAFLRKEREFANILLVEQTNGNFAKTMARALCYDTFMQLLYTAMKNSKDEMLAAIAEKSLKEVNYHYRFSSEWVIRLGDGTPESKQKMQTAIDEIWNYTGEMFMPSNIDTEMMANGVAPDITALQAPWLQKIKEILAEATLVLKMVYIASKWVFYWLICNICKELFLVQSGSR
jgi:ring-1,2-phenylacetyl-CoA epoxidase subunit PaaC